ncbi:hypothetical protein AB1Y20_008881 [Prymnesium parvum]|uniref:Ubiquitin-like protease family profile domain-containing protein n=1 Tax=Prymnesium parvum TaxID=97485 RepID=A0AB34ISG8_PRYPA
MVSLLASPRKLVCSRRVQPLPRRAQGVLDELQPLLGPRAHLLASPPSRRAAPSPRAAPPAPPALLPPLPGWLAAAGGALAEWTKATAAAARAGVERLFCSPAHAPPASPQHATARALASTAGWPRGEEGRRGVREARQQEITRTMGALHMSDLREEAKEEEKRLLLSTRSADLHDSLQVQLVLTETETVHAQLVAQLDDLAELRTKLQSRLTSIGTLLPRSSSDGADSAPGAAATFVSEVVDVEKCLLDMQVQLDGVLQRLCASEAALASPWPRGAEQEARARLSHAKLQLLLLRGRRCAQATRAQAEQLAEWRAAAAAAAARLAARLAAAAPRRLEPRRLSAAEQSRADAAFAKGDELELLAELNNVPVRRRDMKTLAPRQWLNDEIVNSFIELLKMRESQNTSLPRVHFFSSLFYTKLTEHNYKYNSVRRWTSEKKIKGSVFDKEMIMVPVHCHGNHWTLAVVNFKKKQFEYYDSLLGGPDDVLHNLRLWLQDEAQDKNRLPLDLSEWTDVVPKDGIPKQQNGHDCGVFMCKMADHLSQGAVLSFTQADIPYMRLRMAVEILQGATLED